MEKEQTQNDMANKSEEKDDNEKSSESSTQDLNNETVSKEEIQEESLEEKEKEEAYEYGGFVFAKEALNLIDNLERSRQILKNDEKLKNSDALNKTLDHLEIILAYDGTDDLPNITGSSNSKKTDCTNAIATGKSYIASNS